jgi:hypothetical protein
MEIRRWAQEALALHGAAHLEGMALLSSGWSDIAEGSWNFEAAATRFHEVGMAREAAYATMCLGLAQAESGSVDQGLEALEHALGEFERLGDEYCGSITGWNIAGCEASAGRWSRRRQGASWTPFGRQPRSRTEWALPATRLRASTC